jgi:ankyrin repeat protein
MNEIYRKRIQATLDSLKAGYDPNFIINSQGKTGLIDAVENGWFTIVSLYLEYGADPNKQDSQGNTALIYAVRRGLIDIVKLLLLSKKTIVDIQNRSGDTALMIAARRHSINPDFIHMTQLLLEAGANPNIKNYYNESALFFISSRNRHEDIIKLLLDYKADPNITDDHSITPLMVASLDGHINNIITLLHSKKIKIDAKDFQGDTALMYASSLGHLNVIKVLLEAGANPLLKNNKGQTALDIAKKGNHTHTVRFLEKYIALMPFVTAAQLQDKTKTKHLPMDLVRKTFDYLFSKRKQRKRKQNINKSKTKNKKHGNRL